MGTVNYSWCSFRLLLGVGVFGSYSVLLLVLQNSFLGLRFGYFFLLMCIFQVPEHAFPLDFSISFGLLIQPQGRYILKALFDFFDSVSCSTKAQLFNDVYSLLCPTG